MEDLREVVALGVEISKGEAGTRLDKLTTEARQNHHMPNQCRLQNVAEVGFGQVNEGG